MKKKKNMRQALRRSLNKTIRSLGFRPGMTVLDFCCNDGRFTTALAMAVVGNLFVFDVDPDALNRTRAELTRVGASARGWIWDDPEDLAKVLPEPVDAVLMANVLHSVSDKQALARAIASTLKPKGQLAVIDWPLVPQGRLPSLKPRSRPIVKARISPDDINAAFGPAGFGLSKVVDFSPHQFGAVLDKID